MHHGRTRPPHAAGIVGQTTDDGLTRPTPIIRTRTEHVRVVRGQTFCLYVPILLVLSVALHACAACYNMCHVAATQTHTASTTTAKTASDDDDLSFAFVIAVALKIV